MFTLFIKCNLFFISLHKLYIERLFILNWILFFKKKKEEKRKKKTHVPKVLIWLSISVPIEVTPQKTRVKNPFTLISGKIKQKEKLMKHHEWLCPRHEWKLAAELYNRGNLIQF